MSIMGAAGLGAPAPPKPLRKASSIIAALLALADRICARPLSDRERVEDLDELAKELEELRGRRVEGPPFIGDAEDMLLMALQQVAGGDHPSDMRKKWAQIAGVVVGLVQVSLGNALLREARPVATSESVEAEGHAGRSRR